MLSRIMLKGETMFYFPLLKLVLFPLTSKQSEILRKETYVWNIPVEGRRNGLLIGPHTSDVFVRCYFFFLSLVNVMYDMIQSLSLASLHLHVFVFAVFLLRFLWAKWKYTLKQVDANVTRLKMISTKSKWSQVDLNGHKYTVDNAPMTRLMLLVQAFHWTRLKSF